jgi:thiamine pyrophosphokinase
LRNLLVLANGDWGAQPNIAHGVQLAAAADHVVATDGALDLAQAHGIRVDTLIGDMDSLNDPCDLEHRFPQMQILRFPPEKDWTDLELALDWALEQSPTAITIFGATGGRIDHTMANLALLEKGLHAGVPITLLAGDASVRLIQRELCLDDAKVGDRISLLPISLFVTVSTTGLLYPLASDKLFRGKGRGVSNVVVSTPARIDVESGVLAVVHARGFREDV